MSVLTVLSLIFIVLKLTGHIDWSWWLVLLPSILSGVLFAAYVFCIAFESPKHRLKRKYKLK